MSDELCPLCAAPMLIRESRFGKYLCSTFPKCKGQDPADAEGQKVVLERPARTATSAAEDGHPHRAQGPLLACSAIRSARTPSPSTPRRRSRVTSPADHAPLQQVRQAHVAEGRHNAVLLDLPGLSEMPQPQAGLEGRGREAQDRGRGPEGRPWSPDVNGRRSCLAGLRRRGPCASRSSAS